MEDFNINFDNIQICLDEYSKQFIEYLKTLMMKRDAKGYNRVASGALLASLKTRMESDTNYARYSVYLVHLPYLKYLESGTRPHYPPFAPILKWVRDKGIPTREKTGNKKLPTERGMAYLVQQKIGKEGTEGIPMVKQTQDALNPTLERKLEEAFVSDINEFLRQPMMTISLKFE